MTIGITVLLACIAGYFLSAVFVPRIRLRWGVERGSSITISRAGIERAKWTRRLPRLGAISSLGFAMFFGGFIFPSALVGLKGGVIPLLGLGLAAIGAVLDWLRDPPTSTKR